MTYVIPETYEKALKLLRTGLAREGLTVVAELDISGRLRQEFGVDPQRCRTLLVDCPLLLLEAIALDPTTAALMPLHVVVTAEGTRTLVHWIDVARLCNGALPPEAGLPVKKLQTRLAVALEGVAMRRGVAELVA